MKDKVTSDSVRKNRMHAAHEQSLEPSSTSDKDQEKNKRECKTRSAALSHAATAATLSGLREREREPREERERERALAAEHFHALSRAANALTHACLLQRECRELIDKTSCQRDPDMGMPQSVLPDVESAACTTPVEANMQTSSGQPRGALMISRSGSDSESPSEAVASAEAEVAGRCGFGTGAAECAGGGSAGRAEVCAGVPGERARVRNIKPEETPRSQIDVFAKGLKRHRNGLHRQLRASVLRRAGPQSGQYCSPELLLRPECSQDVVSAI